MFEGKAVLVTGASSGLGREIALAFGKRGATVGLMARREDRLHELASDIRIFGGEAVVLPTDISSDAELNRSLDLFMNKANRLDVLINNAGMGVFGRRPTKEEYMTIYQVNVHAVYQLSLLSTPFLQQTKGTVINIGSSVIDRPFAGEMVYAATKGAVTAMTKAMAATFGNSGIRVNLIQPGVIASEFNVAAGLPPELDEKVYNASLGLNAIHSTGYPGDIAQAALFLASEHSRFITGAILKVDGGLTLGTIKP